MMKAKQQLPSSHAVRLADSLRSACLVGEESKRRSGAALSRAGSSPKPMSRRAALLPATASSTALLAIGITIAQLAGTLTGIAQRQVIDKTGLSGNYDPAAWDGWGERGDAAYFNNPMDYVGHLGGDHLDWLRSQLSLLLICGQGQWEDTTGALASTRRLAELLQSKGIRCEMDLWGYDVPHDWPSWRAQLAHHLPRFC